jgi:hypothetical protein
MNNEKRIPHTRQGIQTEEQKQKSTPRFRG